MIRPIPGHNIRQTQREHEYADCYQPKKSKIGIHCVGDQFEYVVPWQARNRTKENSLEEENSL